MAIIRPLTTIDETRAAVALLVGEAEASYISHSELMFGRAKSLTEWADDLEARVTAEFEEIVQGNAADRMLLGAYEGDALAAFAVLAFEHDTPAPFATLEDVIVSASFRAKGLLRQIVETCETIARDAGLQRIFLESGVANDGAHHAFERLGFGQTSIVMSKDLT